MMLHDALCMMQVLRDRDFATVPLCAPTATGCLCKRHPQPCASRGKKPLLRGYDDFDRDPPRLLSMLRALSDMEEVNLAIIAGKRWCIVEADSAEADAEVRSLGGKALDLTPERGARPGRGAAWIFEQEQTEPPRFGTHLGESMAIDCPRILVTGGSTHRTTFVYPWVRSPLTHPPMPLPSALKELLRKRRRTTPSRRAALKPNWGGTSTIALAIVKSNYRLNELFEGRGKTHGDTSASGYDFSLALALVQRRLDPSVIAYVLRARPLAHRRDDAYVIETVEKALAVARGLSS